MFPKIVDVKRERERGLEEVSWSHHYLLLKSSTTSWKRPFTEGERGREKVTFLKVFEHRMAGGKISSTGNKFSLFKSRSFFQMVISITWTKWIMEPWWIESWIGHPFLSLIQLPLLFFLFPPQHETFKVSNHFFLFMNRI